MNEESRYQELEMDSQSIINLLIIAQSGDLVAIVDNEYGDIIGYAIKTYSEEVFELLNSNPSL